MRNDNVISIWKQHPTEKEAMEYFTEESKQFENLMMTVSMSVSDACVSRANHKVQAVEKVTE